MKNAMVIFLVCSILAGAAAPAHCHGPEEKLGRGFANLLTFPCEIPYQISQARQQNGLAGAVTYGFVGGFFMAAVRAVVGVYEIATFPFPTGNFEPMLTNPEFFFSASND